MHTHVRRCPAHMLRMCMCMCMYLRCRYADTVPMDGLVLFTRQSTPDTDAGVRTVFKRMGNKRMATEGATPSSAFLNTNLPNSPPAPDTERDIQEHAAACKANGALYPHALAHAHIACACTCTCTCTHVCMCMCMSCACNVISTRTCTFPCIVLPLPEAATAAAYKAASGALAEIVGRPQSDVLNELYRCSDIARRFCIRLLRAQVDTHL